MKVLFAVNSEKISEAIIKKYQTMYKEIISWKNVYFFNAIIKELQKDKSYDRIVIGEDLEPFANNNYEVIDNFLFDKLDSISDEASNSREGDIPIIMIATDRREKGENLLVKLFGIGVYNVILGQDRKIENVCKLIYQPRTKKEAKAYYRVEADGVDYQSVDPDNVSELEIQNIIRHYKKIGKDEQKCIESFEEIATQYTDIQLKLITKFLPLNVRAILEEKCPKYQQVMIGSVKGQINAQKAANRQFTAKNIESRNVNKIDLIDKELKKSKLTKPVVIPSAINMQNVKKAYKNEEQPKDLGFDVDAAIINSIPEEKKQNVAPENRYNKSKVELANIYNEQNNELTNKYNEQEDKLVNKENEQNVEPVKKGRGRPKKEKTPEEIALEEAKVKKGRGRPKKVVEQRSQNIDDSENDIDLFGLASDKDEVDDILSNMGDNPKSEENTVLPGLEEDFSSPEQEEDFSLPGLDNDENLQNDIPNKELFPNDVSLSELPGMENFKEEEYRNTKNKEATNQIPQSYNNNSYTSNKNTTGNTTSQSNISQNAIKQDTTGNVQNQYDDQSIISQYTPNTYSNSYVNTTNTQLERANPVNGPDRDLANLITGDKKVVAFVGTSKNGTSFLVNNVAANLSAKGINTAILDLTKNKNAYYIYTSNEDGLREKAFKCIDGLRSGVADGIKVNKNLTVYTTLPGPNLSFNDYKSILETLARNYSLVLLDCDFETDLNYFANAQEIYLVQTYDILTIQPLTAFLNELKHKDILEQNKLRIVINKTLKLRKLTDRMIIGGISCYNDPASTYINTLFDKEKIKYINIPFEDQTYARYLERLVDCDISLNGYSKMFLTALNQLSDMVYPLIAGGNSKYTPTKNYNDYNKKNTNINTNTTFNSNMNETLNKMRNNF